MLCLPTKILKRPVPEKNKIIEITEFVDEKEIDSIYYETPYYLQPDKNGVKAYTLLRDALKKTGKVGLGSFVLTKPGKPGGHQTIRKHFTVE